mgnify:CR=1 FL=1
MKDLKQNKTKRSAKPVSTDRKALEKKAQEGAEKAVREYGRVFERLAEYDKT